MGWVRLGEEKVTHGDLLVGVKIIVRFVSEAVHNIHYCSFPHHLFSLPGRHRRSAAAARRGTALGSKCGQCHVVSRRRTLNTDWYAFLLLYVVTEPSWGGSVAEWLACWTQAQ